MEKQIWGQSGAFLLTFFLVNYCFVDYMVHSALDCLATGAPTSDSEQPEED